ncbi:hypothetical protein DXG01_016098 [Tephrocybe rancida]|nr:hypothetical protein DXG01_016098 [Tephrocybe rancida]
MNFLKVHIGKSCNVIGMQEFSFKFAPEIEDQIFEHATYTHPQYAHNLSVVSRRVQKCVEPIIYETLVFITYEERFQLRGMVYAERFLNTLSSRSPAFFAAYVHNVCITNTVGGEFVTLLLGKCTNIRNLAVWKRYATLDSDIHIVNLITPPSPTLLSFSTGRNTLKKLAEAGYVFPSLTNLSVGVRPVDVSLVDLDWLPALKAVRLRFSQQPFVDDQWWQDVLTVLSTAPQLQVLYVDVDASCLEEVEAKIHGAGDQRIQARDERRIWDPVEEWKEMFTSLI